MANAGIRTPASGGVVPSRTLAIIECTFDNSAATLVLTNGTITHYTFRDLSGAFCLPLAYWYVVTATPTAATLIIGITATTANITLSGLGNITSTSNGTLFLLGPGLFV